MQVSAISEPPGQESTPVYSTPNKQEAGANNCSKLAGVASKSSTTPVQITSTNDGKKATNGRIATGKLLAEDLRKLISRLTNCYLDLIGTMRRSGQLFAVPLVLIAVIMNVGKDSHARRLFASTTNSLLDSLLMT